MDITQLFNPVEEVTGVEIAQGFVRAAIVRRDKKGALSVIKKSAALPRGVVHNGKIMDAAALAAVLKEFRTGNKDLFPSKYIILALPPAFTFADTMQAPQLSPEQTEETVRLAMNTKNLFPRSSDDVYYDWQPARSHDAYHQEVLVSFALRERIAEYLAVCEAAGLEPLAFEPAALATTRTLHNFKDTNGIIVNIKDEGVEFALVSHDELRFSRFIAMPPVATLAEFESFISTELSRVINFYSVENPHDPEPRSIVLFSLFQQKKEIADVLSKNVGVSVENARSALDVPLEDASVAAYGAALRGAVRREDDTMISIMPVGTEEVYRVRRFGAYVSLWSDITGATAMLFAALFGGMWLIVTNAHTNMGTRIAQSQSASATALRITELESAAQTFNTVVADIAAAENMMYPWSEFIRALTPTLEYNGVTIKNITMPAPNGELTVGIVAATRDGAIAFRKELENSGRYESVRMPSLGIMQKENIVVHLVLKMKQQP